MVKIKCIILCAGYATRLYPLTQNQPKSLLAVGDKPILDYIMDQVEQLEDVTEIFIVTNDRFLPNFWSWRETYSPKKRTHLFSDGTKSNEERIGAIGDLHLVIEKKKINEDLLVIAGDNLFEFDLKNLISQFKSKKAPVVALYDIKDKARAAKKYGIAVIDSSNKITEFQEKPASPKTTLVSTGCYVFTKESAKKISEYATESDHRDNPGDFITWLSKREPVHGFIFSERWFDIGSFEALEEAYEAYKKSK